MLFSNIDQSLKVYQNSYQSKLASPYCNNNVGWKSKEDELQKIINNKNQNKS